MRAGPDDRPENVEHKDAFTKHSLDNYVVKIHFIQFLHLIRVIKGLIFFRLELTFSFKKITFSYSQLRKLMNFLIAFLKTYR